MKDEIIGNSQSLSLGTDSVWSGEEKVYWHGATVPPVSINVAYAYEEMKNWKEVALGNQDGFIYSRNANPITSLLETKMAGLELAETACSFSTGMAAISNTLSTFLLPGDRLVSQKDCYGGTSVLFMNFLPQRGVEVDLVDTTDTGAMVEAIRKGCSLLYLETPTNPTLKVVDIRRLSEEARNVGALVVLDNTFATPINQRPLALGVDLVVYSATKFLCGHSDALGGILCGKRDFVQKVHAYREIYGAALHPFSAYLILRGLKTLELRMLRHNENAQLIAEFLERHPKVENVFYPGLKSSPQHDLAASQMSGFGGVLSFSVKGDFQSVITVLENLKLARLAAHLGSVDTIAGIPATTSHVEVTPEERKKLGIPENLIRYSTGIENAADLISDLDQALKLI